MNSSSSNIYMSNSKLRRNSLSYNPNIKKGETSINIKSIY